MFASCSLWEPASHVRRVHRLVCRAMEALSPWGIPHSLRRCRFVAKRLGLLIRSVPFDRMPEPTTKYDYWMEQGTVYLPTGAPKLRLRWLLHEIIEVVLGLERWQSVEYPPAWGSDHDLALMVEEIELGPRPAGV